MNETTLIISRVAALLLLISCATTKLFAGITFQIPAPGDQLPTKYSGTNCIASGYAEGTNGDYLTEVKLIIKSSAGIEHVVSTWTPEPPPPGGQPVVTLNMSRRVYFASTHFENQSTVKLIIRAKNSQGNEFESDHVERPV